MIRLRPAGAPKLGATMRALLAFLQLHEGSVNRPADTLARSIGVTELRFWPALASLAEMGLVTTRKSDVGLRIRLTSAGFRAATH